MIPRIRERVAIWLYRHVFNRRDYKWWIRELEIREAARKLGVV